MITRKFLAVALSLNAAACSLVCSGEYIYTGQHKVPVDDTKDKQVEDHKNKQVPNK